MLIITTAVIGAYLVYSSSQAKKTPSHSFEVGSNEIVLVKLPGFNYSEGIWQLQLSNAGNATQSVTYQLFENGELAYGNSSTLQPGQRSNITACLNLVFGVFRVPIFVSNSSGTFSANYPVTVDNPTQTLFSGQFSVSNNLRASVYNSEFKGNFSSWSITVSNVGTNPIEFAYAELWNNTTILSGFQVLCAGESYLNNYGQPLAPGQSASGTRPFLGAGSVIAGKTYRVNVVAVYSDFSEVTQTYEIQATG